MLLQKANWERVEFKFPINPLGHHCLVAWWFWEQEVGRQPGMAMTIDPV